MDNTRELPVTSQESMTTSVDISQPPRPAPKACEGLCGKLIQPEFIPPQFYAGKLMSFSNIWEFRRERCDSCFEKAVEQEKKRTEQGLRNKREETLRKMIGPKAFTEYTFDRFEPVIGSHIAMPALR